MTTLPPNVPVAALPTVPVAAAGKKCPGKEAFTRGVRDSDSDSDSDDSTTRAPVLHGGKGGYTKGRFLTKGPRTGPRKCPRKGPRKGPRTGVMPEDQSVVDAAVAAATGAPLTTHVATSKPVKRKAGAGSSGLPKKAPRSGKTAVATPSLDEGEAAMLAAMAAQAPRRKSGKKKAKAGEAPIARRMVGKKGKGGKQRIPECPHLTDDKALGEFRKAFMGLVGVAAKWPVLMANPLLSLISTAKMGGILSEALVAKMGEMLILNCPLEHLPTRLQFLTDLPNAPLSVGRTRADCSVPTVAKGFTVDAVLRAPRSTQLVAGNTMPQSTLATARSVLIEAAQKQVAAMAAAEAEEGDDEEEDDDE